jgi:hypothetical protein
VASRRRPALLGLAGVLIAAVMVLFLMDPLSGPRVVAPPQGQGVAVLPFTTEQGGPGPARLAAGAGLALASRLTVLAAGTPEFWVVPPGEVDRHQDPSTALSALGADRLLTGRLRETRGAPSLRLSVLDAATLKVLSETEMPLLDTIHRPDSTLIGLLGLTTAAGGIPGSGPAGTPMGRCPGPGGRGTVPGTQGE